jgi:curli biogenesis system outer membrane secretion channel CsgG
VSTLNKESVRGTLEQHITKSREYKVVDRSRTNEVLREHSFQRNGMVDNNSAKAIGKLLGAKLVCVAEILKQEGYTNINISIIDVETGEVENSGTRLFEGDTPMEIKRTTEEIASEILAGKR